MSWPSSCGSVAGLCCGWLVCAVVIEGGRWAANAPLAVVVVLGSMLLLDDDAWRGVCRLVMWSLTQSTVPLCD